MVESTETGNQREDGDTDASSETSKVNAASASQPEPNTASLKAEEFTEAEIGTRNEIHSLLTRFKDGSEETVTQEKYKPSDFDPTSIYALVFKKKYDEFGLLKEKTLTINSVPLLRLLEKQIRSHPSLSGDFTEPLTIKAPWEVLLHSWSLLEQLLQENQLEHQDAIPHLQLLLDFMNGEMGDLRSKLQKMTASGQITFDLLWAIFDPNGLFVKKERGYTALFKVEKTLYEQHKDNGAFFEIHCTHVCHDGNGLQLRSEMVNIFERSHIGGKQPSSIASLPIYPYAFLPGADDNTIAELQSRGKRASKIIGTTTMSYTGTAEYQKLPPYDYFQLCLADMEDIDLPWLGCYESGRVVIDPQTFLDDFPYEGKRIFRSHDYNFDNWAVKIFGSANAGRLALCTPWLFGFSLQRKDWCKFYIPNLAPVQWDADALTKLALPANQKALVSALVLSHDFPNNPREESEQKGKGLVCLLYGPPGSGKTLTAEVAAETSHSPLLPISMGNLYEGSWFEETKLTRLLRLGTIFRAIVLIDEADVFLEARTSGNGDGRAAVERNSLVATFLRRLEYFSGVAFLTSNRVESFDAAMKSRIHLSLKYDPPAVQVRSKIWRSRLEALPAESVGLKIDSAISRLAREDMSGREIANTIVTAGTLARHEKVKLELRHLETVVEVWREFDEGLEKMKSAIE